MTVVVASFIAVMKILLYEFHETLQPSTAPCEDLLYQVSPKSDNECRKCGQNSIYCLK